MLAHYIDDIMQNGSCSVMLIRARSRNYSELNGRAFVYERMGNKLDKNSGAFISVKSLGVQWHM